MARHADKKGLSIGVIVAAAIFVLVAVVSAFLIFHPGGELASSTAQFAREPKIQSSN